MVNTYKEAKPRILSQQKKIIAMLKEAYPDGVTSIQFQSVGIRWDARVRELYQYGYVINCELVKDGVYKYTLVKEPSQKQKSENALDVLMRLIEEQFDGTITIEELRELLSEEYLHVVRKNGYWANQGRTIERDEFDDREPSDD